MPQNNTYIINGNEFIFPTIIDGQARDVVTVNKCDEQVQIFAQDLFDFVAEVIKNKRIKKINDMTTSQVLELLI